MNEVWTWFEISKLPSRNSFIFKLRERELSNYFFMYNLSSSFCGYRTFRRVQNIKIIRWTIPSKKYEFPIIPYPTAFPYGNGMVLHFYQQQESSTTKTVHKVINKGLKTYV